MRVSKEVEKAVISIGTADRMQMAGLGIAHHLNITYRRSTSCIIPRIRNPDVHVPALDEGPVLGDGVAIKKSTYPRAIATGSANVRHLEMDDVPVVQQGR